MSFTVSVVTKPPRMSRPTLAVLPLYSDQSTRETIPGPLRQKIAAQLRALKFTADSGRAVVFPVWQARGHILTAVIGLGPKQAAATAQAEALRRGMGHAVGEARKHNVATIMLTLTSSLSAPEFARAAVEGATLANYRFVDYTERRRQEHAARAVRKLIIVVPAEMRAPVRAAVAAAEQVLTGVALARDLVNQPASAMTPRHLVEAAQALTKRSRRLTVTVLDRAASQAAGFNAFLAVAQGSIQEPYLIHLKYSPPKPTQARVAVVGKGITFDSGGLSLKPADMMETMKIDMAGAASVLGLFSVLPALAPAVEVHGIIAACENMPSGTAYRPGDIIRTKTGKTIEVLNTDAEGRVTLADALTYAREQKPDVIIDLATLTGACMIGLGETIAGLWSNNETLQQDLLSAAAETGEGLCALPLPDEYRPFIDSQVADLRNIATTKFGGAITAALFLREFVGDTPWAHLDIAGPSYAERKCLPYFSYGATGYGVRTLAEYLDRTSRAA